MKLLDREKKITFALTIVITLVVGLLVGHFIIPKDIRTELIQQSGDYVRFQEMTKNVLYPFNETDVVTATIAGKVMAVNHTVAGGLYTFRHYEMGIDDNGFWEYLSQWR